MRLFDLFGKSKSFGAQQQQRQQGKDESSSLSLKSNRANGAAMMNLDSNFMKPSLPGGARVPSDFHLHGNLFATSFRLFNELKNAQALAKNNTIVKPRPIKSKII